jgi:hypothetical protein
MPGYPVPDSGGAPAPDNAGPKSGFLPSGKPGGQITISRREALALIAFDSEDDEKTAIARARRETSFDDDQLARLKSRAEKVRAKGYTLTNGAHKFMPTNFDGDTDSLLGAEEQRGDAKNRPARDGKRTAAAAKAAPAKGKAKEVQVDPSWRIPAGPTRRTQEAWARVHECDGDAMCGPCRAAHDAAAPAREAFAKRMREKKRKTSCMHESTSLAAARDTLLREAARRRR